MSINKTNPYQSRFIEIRSTELFNGMVIHELYLPKLKPDVGNLAGQPERSIEPRNYRGFVLVGKIGPFFSEAELLFFEDESGVEKSVSVIGSEEELKSLSNTINEWHSKYEAEVQQKLSEGYDIGEWM